MFTQFRTHYPNGSLITELSAIEHGQYIVRCLVQVEGTTLVTSLAAAHTVELAEDQARSRALELLGISASTLNGEKETPIATPKMSVLPTPTPQASPVFSSQNLGQPDSTAFPEAAKTTSEASHLSFSESEFKDDEDTDWTTKTPQIVEDTTFTDFSEPSSVENHQQSYELPSVDTSLLDSPEVETSQVVETPKKKTKKKSKTQLNDAPVEPSKANEVETDTTRTPVSTEPIDFSEIIARTNVELKRLGWTNQQGRDYLVQTYGKRSRQLLTDEELLDFLHHLEAQPTPD